MKNWIKAYKKQHMIVITVLLLVGVVGAGAILGGCALKDSDKVVAAEEKDTKKQTDTKKDKKENVSEKSEANQEASLEEKQKPAEVKTSAEPEQTTTDTVADASTSAKNEAGANTTPKEPATQPTTNVVTTPAATPAPTPTPTPAPTQESQEHVHNWVLSEAAWDEPVYASRTLCNSCNADITENADHIFWCGIGSYRNATVQVDTIHHPDVYKCSCGATK